jgi:hypothetical protein
MTVPVANWPSHPPLQGPPPPFGPAYLPPTPSHAAPSSAPSRPPFPVGSLVGSIQPNPTRPNTPPHNHQYGYRRPYQISHRPIFGGSTTNWEPEHTPNPQNRPLDTRQSHCHRSPTTPQNTHTRNTRPSTYSPTSVGSKSCTQWFRVSHMILREQISTGLSTGWAISHTKWAVFLDKKAGRNGLGQNSWRLACWRPTGDKRLGRWCGRGCHPDRQEDFPPPRGRSPGVPEAEGAPGISTG